MKHQSLFTKQFYRVVHLCYFALGNRFIHCTERMRPFIRTSNSNAILKNLRMLLALLVCIPFSSSSLLSDFSFTPEYLRELASRYDSDVTDRFLAWQKLISDGRSDSDWQRIHNTNQFANSKIAFLSDLDNWQQNDYWATPVESLALAKGDCEDYAIFKYMTLRAMGVEEDKLRLMYVRALSVNQPHMVLIYLEQPDQYPLVLDNLTDVILPANKRPDLVPVYSFNGQGLWMAKAQGRGKKVPNSPGVKNWQILLDRIEAGQ